MLVGENNVGKTNIFTALRLFYENGNLKYKKQVDFPKFADDGESWMELAFKTTEDEQDGLKDEYKSEDGVLRVRKYYQSKEKDLVKPNQSNIYAYESGGLSNNLFYGARNVSQAKLGKVIYIPAVSKTDETLKLSGPSPFREMLNLVMKRTVSKSSTFDNLRTAFDTFNSEFKKQSSKEEPSISSLIHEINSEIAEWDVRFDVSINSIKPEEIVKNLLAYHIEDLNLGGEQINLASFGQGFQRHLIFTLIKLSAKYTTPSVAKKKDFDPDFALLLFEEPEAFLHPSQQESLHLSLRTLASGAAEQILISSHSPHFVSKQISHLTGIVRLSKDNGITKTFQITKDVLSGIIDENLGLYRKFCDCLKSTQITEKTKGIIRDRELGEENPNLSGKVEEEALKYFLWLDSERSSLFFAKKVIVCEGASEKVFIEYLFDKCWPEFKEKHLYLLDVLGKYNIHRFMALLAALGIEHSVLFDSDQDSGIHKIINSFIQEQKTDFAKTIHVFNNDFEEFLGIEKPKRRDLRPLNVIVKYQNHEISSAKLTELKAILEEM